MLPISHYKKEHERRSGHEPEVIKEHDLLAAMANRRRLSRTTYLLIGSVNGAGAIYQFIKLSTREPGVEFSNFAVKNRPHDVWLAESPLPSGVYRVHNTTGAVLE